MKHLRKLSGFCFAAFAAMLLFGANGEAYIDPSVMTYIIQAVAGIIIAVGAAVGIYWRRAKKKINASRGIDENRNKEVESAELVVNAEEEAEPSAETQE